MQLIAIKPLRYATRALAAGDRFEAPEMDAKILVYATKKAKFAKAEPQRTPAVAVDSLDRLRAEARRLGIVIDNRWGAKRLQSEIAAKQSRGLAI